MQRAALLVLMLLGWATAAPYRPISLASVATVPLGAYVRVWGRYQPGAAAQTRISGRLVSGDRALRVEGRVFDWRPEPGARVELWGRLAPGPLLRVHNGRAAGEARRPRPTPPLREGEMLSVWLVVSRAGPAPFLFAQGVTEDRRVFLLPRYRGRQGVVCLRGVVGFLEGPAGPKALLRGATRCAVRSR